MPAEIVRLLACCALAATASVVRSSDRQAGDTLAADLAMPFASDLVGARHAPVFAWVEDEAGARNIWIGGPRLSARSLTHFAGDDGIELSDLALAADGRRLAFVRGGDPDFPDANLANAGILPEPPEQVVFVADAAGDRPSLRIGSGHGPAFAPDGRQVAFVRGGEILWWSGEGAAQRLALVSGEVGALQWSPDGRLLLFTEQRRGHSLIGLIDRERRTLRYLAPTLGEESDPVFSPDGRQVAFIQYRDPPAELDASQASFWSLRVMDVAGDAVRTVWTAPAGEGGQYAGTHGRNLVWSSGGELLFPWERTGWMHVYALSATGGTPRDLTPAANEVESFALAPGGTALVYTANPSDLDSRQLWRVPLAGGAATRLTGEGAFVFAPVVAGDALAATATDARHPAHIVLVDRMMPLGPAPVAASFVRPQVVTFTAADGLRVHGQLFPGAGPGPHPALVYVHGGPRRQMLPGFIPMHYYSNAYILNQQLAAKGYIVLSVNYRSGTGYGRAFREAPGIARAGAAEYRDVLAGGRWLAARPEVDPKRIGIWGGSWGGYLTALALARDSDLFAAGADFHGVHAMVRPIEPTLSPAEEAKAHQEQWDSSPMAAIDRWRSPVLLVHGDDDKDVDYAQSLLLARELTARGVPFEELSLPNERHGFLRYADWLATYRATDAFFARTLSPAGAGPGRGARR